MSIAVIKHTRPPNWSENATAWARNFAANAAEADAEDRFVAANFAALKADGAFAAGVPASLGGGGASIRELADMLRILAHGCGSTALAFAMHTHPVATAAWRWTYDKAPVEPLLRRIATEHLQIASTGGSDWLMGSGRAEKVADGFLIHAHKSFVSGSPSADLAMTSAVYDDPQAGPTVLHFAIPLKAPGVSTVATWQAHGMRGTGSHDVIFDGVHIKDAAVSGRRPAGPWHRLFHIISMVAFPLIYSVYLGIAEAAREAAIQAAQKRRNDPLAQRLAGEMENALFAARTAHEALLACSDDKPGLENTNRVFQARAQVEKSALAVLDRAVTLAGGGSYFRRSPLERLWRDIQAARFHPLQENDQLLLAGQMALGVPPKQV
ncbi:MAG: acyl-CoA dehydrogenase family protein [Alphaproteobacteria bacterium]